MEAWLARLWLEGWAGHPDYEALKAAVSSGKFWSPHEESNPGTLHTRQPSCH